jgi:formyltetrahydrofolate-dependent phosphoribosylglycinamide formyltransferase
LAVLASGGGTTLQNLIDQIAQGRLNARIGTVIASRDGVGALDRAAKVGLRSCVIERKRFSSVGDFSEPIFRCCDEAQVDLICCAGWLSMLAIPLRYDGRIMNIHPALLPSFGGQGMYGRRVHEAVLNHGCKVSGCTVHFVNEEYDSGPIILQRTCAVMEDDTPETLAHRVFEQEKIAYPQAIGLFAAGRLKIEGRRVRVFD